MRRNAVAWLVGEDPSARGVYEEPSETRRKVFCQVRTAYMQEVQMAMSTGHEPTKVLLLADEREWQGEEKCEFEGKVYRIIHTFVRGDLGIELTLEKWK
jgi:hypothetical protein